MFSKLYLKIIAHAIKIIAYFGGSPFLWDSKNSKLYVTLKQEKKFRIRVIFILMRTLFFGGRAIQKKLDGNRNEFNLSMVAVYIGISVCIFQSIFVFRSFEVAYASNAFFYFFKKNHRTWMSNYDPDKARFNWYWDRLILGFVILLLASGIPSLITFALDPYMNIAPAQLIPEQFRNPLVVIIQCLVIFFVGQAEGTFWLVIFHLLQSYFMLMPRIIEQDLRANRRSYRTRDDLRSAQFLPGVYRGVELLHKIVMKEYGVLMMPLQAAVTQLVLLCFYTIIRQGKELDRAVVQLLVTYAMIGLFAMSVILWAGGVFSSISNKTIRSWKYFNWTRKVDLKHINKFRKSCRPLRIGVEGVYTIKRISILKFLQGIVRGTFRALLALK